MGLGKLASNYKNQMSVHFWVQVQEGERKAVEINFSAVFFCLTFSLTLLHQARGKYTRGN